MEIINKIKIAPSLKRTLDGVKRYYHAILMLDGANKRALINFARASARDHLQFHPVRYVSPDDSKNRELKYDIRHL